MSRLHRIGLILMGVGSILGCARGAGSSGTPTDVVTQLYSAIRTAGVSGAPSEAELVALTPYLSEEMTGLLRGARAMRDADVAKSPDEKPAFAEGDLFTSLFEGSTAQEVVADTADGPVHRLAVRFTYDVVPPPVRWTDQVVVIEERGRYVVADVRYGGDWDFGNKGSLVASLRTALAPAAPK